MKQEMWSFRLASACLFAALCVSAVRGRCGCPAETGTISGRVGDPSGAAISGAKVALTQQGQSLPSATTTTIADGTYSFSSVETGTYILSAESSGFQMASRENIVVASQQKVVADLTLLPLRPSAASGGSGPKKAESPLDDVNFADSPQLKPGGLTGSVDPGGYSTPAQAERTTRLLEGATRLKGGSTTRSPEAAAGATPAEKEDLVKVEQAMKKSVETHPGDFAANHQLGEFYIHVGQLASAIPYLEKAYCVDPSHYVNAYDLALAYFESRNYTAARAQLRSMIQRQDTAELHDLLAEAEEKLGNYVEAANEYEKAAHMDPTEHHIFDWGVELLLHRTIEPATEVFQQGVARYPRSPKLWIGLGIALYSRGRYDDAVKAFAQATDLNPSDPRPYLFLGKLYNISTAEAPTVSERLRRFAQLQPDNPQALYYHAMSLWKGTRAQSEQASAEQVVSLFRKAATLDPTFPDVHLQLGILYAEQQKSTEAIQEYQQAIELQPSLAEAHYRLAQALGRTGQKDRAQHEFEVYQQLHQQQVADSERQRAEIQQFVYTIKDNPPP